MKKCNLCESDKVNLMLKVGNYKIYKCENCHVKFLYLFPENIEKIYDEEYFKKWYLSSYKERKKYFKLLLGKIKINEYVFPGSKLIDIGCGIGIFLEIMKEKNYEVYGQDISDFAVDFCVKKGFRMYDKPMSEIDLPENFFDLVTLFDVIAHLKKPNIYLQKCKRILKKKGILIIKTPLHSNFIFFIAKFFQHDFIFPYLSVL